MFEVKWGGGEEERRNRVGIYAGLKEMYWRRWGFGMCGQVKRGVCGDRGVEPSEIAGCGRGAREGG